MKDILTRLFDYQALERNEAYEILKNIGEGTYNPSQIAAFLTIYQMRPVTVEELTGFRDALLDLCIAVDLSDFDAMDLCGTGGDGKDTFNISTISSFVVAGAGVPVAKHGNYGVSSACGSSNVMEHLGYDFTADPDKLRKQINRAGICFLHAPKFHPAMKYVGSIRRELGVKTFFNMLGPMVNPSRPNKQLVGVFSLELARLYNYLYQQSDKQYVILHSLDGYDEISLTGAFKSITPTQESVHTPEAIGLSRLSPSDLFGGQTVDEAGKIFLSVLQNNGTPAQTEVVCANAGSAIHCARPELTLDESIETARESLESGQAYSSFKKLLAA